MTPFATGVGATFSRWDLDKSNGGTTFTAQIPRILSAHAYINFHTSQFPGGEIRGTLIVPEPSTLALMGDRGPLAGRPRLAKPRPARLLGADETA